MVAGQGICEASSEQSTLKQLMTDRSREVQVHVLADAGKLGRADSHWWSSFERPWTLITDAGASAERLAPFREDPLCTLTVAGQPG